MTQDPLDPGSFVTFGELLKHLRHRARLTQRDLGTAVGYSFTTISKIEANERLPDTAVIRARFVEALGLERTPALANRLLELARAGRGVTAEAGTPVVALTEDRGAQIPMMGRGAEFQRLKAAWTIAASGKPQVAIITGEAGIGKTRLAEELAAWARRQGAATAIGHCYAAEGALAYAPVQAWLREPAFLDAQRKLDPLWLTEIARLLPEITVARPDLPRPGPLSEGWQRQRFHEALVRALITTGRPLLLFVDDLQWTDRETLEWLRFLLRADPGARLLLLGTARSEELSDAHPLNAFIEAVRGGGQFVGVELGPLSSSETAALGAYVAGISLTLAQSDRLFRETEGSPLFAVEMLRSEAWGAHPGDPRSAAGPAQVVTPIEQLLPSTVQAVISRRLGQLSPEAKALAGLAATLGREFTFAVLAAAVQQPDNALVATLEELLHRRIVRERFNPTDQTIYDFTHDKIRAVAYAGLSASRRRLLHRQAGQALASIHERAPDIVSAQIAVHFDRAGLPGDACAYYTRAAETSRKVFANDDAIRCYRRALELLNQEPLHSAEGFGEQARAVCESLGDLLHLTGRHADAQRLFERGLALALPGPAGRLARARIGRKIGNTLVPRHIHDEAETAFARADAALGDENQSMDPPSRSEWLRLQADRTLLYYWMNQPDKIQALVERMRPVLERGDAPAERALVFRALQLAHMRLSRYVVSDEILGYSAECLAAQRQLNDPAGLNFAVFMRGFVWLFRGELDLAETQLREALELAERLGDVTVQTRALNYLSVICRKRGDTDGAATWVERTLTSAEKAGMPEYVAQGRSNLAWIAWKRGRFAEAESIARAASDWIRQTPAIRAIDPLPWEALFPLLDIDSRNANLTQSVDDARLLLVPEGQRLPDALADELQAAIDEFDRGEADATRDRLRLAIALAQKTGFL